MVGVPRSSALRGRAPSPPLTRALRLLLPPLTLRRDLTPASYSLPPPPCFPSPFCWRWRLLVPAGENQQPLLPRGARYIASSKTIQIFVVILSLFARSAVCVRACVHASKRASERASACVPASTSDAMLQCDSPSDRSHTRGTRTLINTRSDSRCDRACESMQVFSFPRLVCLLVSLEAKAEERQRERTRERAHANERERELPPQQQQQQQQQPQHEPQGAQRLSGDLNQGGRRRRPLDAKEGGVMQSL